MSRFRNGYRIVIGSISTSADGLTVYALADEESRHEKLHSNRARWRGGVAVVETGLDPPDFEVRNAPLTVSPIASV